MIEKIFNRTKVLEKALDASWKKNEVISHNIANVDTPNYKRKTVKFEEFLEDAINSSKIKGSQTHEKHIPIGYDSIDNIKIDISTDYSDYSMRLDGNNVDIENEMAQLAKNNIKYSTLTQRISGMFKSIKSVIREGG